uniref:Fanconi anemia group J protein homolog n=1 Tax=Cacopsylla melanoneura TaxID=428564 RepID=A0A8D8RQK0_9HEMI
MKRNWRNNKIFFQLNRQQLSPDVTSIAGTSSSADNLDSTMSSSSLFDESVIEEALKNPVPEKVRVPSVSKIFYGTRTHKQITQIVRELKKTVYKDQLRMTILSSRKHTCINDEVRRSKKNINDHCQELKETEVGTYLLNHYY